MLVSDKVRLSLDVSEVPRVDRCDPGRARREERLGGLAVETD